MKYFNPANLAIIACPGGDIFAEEVISHLRSKYRHNRKQTVNEISKLYNVDPDYASLQIDLINKIVVRSSSSLSGTSRLTDHKFRVPVKFTQFPNGEVKSEIEESIRGKDVYVFQDVENRYPVKFASGTVTNLSINDHLMTLFVTIDATRQAGAERITLVIPNYPYARQHKAKGREGLSASRIGKIFESLGVDRIITLDIHSRDIINAFDKIRLENLHASFQIIQTLSKMDGILNDDFVVVSPDTGAVDRNKFFASALKKPLALLYKERDYSKVSRDASQSNISQIRLLGDVQDKTVFMADDMLGTGGTLIKGMRHLKENGARRIICSVSLPLFSGNAIEHFDEAYREGLFYRIIGTNAVYQEEVIKKDWYISVNISRLFAHVISRLHQNQSVSSLLDNAVIINRLVSQTMTSESQNELPFHNGV
ncbi:MAG: ribose-phosphate diphosphokinase [Treponema sp.]|nr:ribose-phosphate diphosphokinase [Treponema sp.]MCL2271918.1 ribose-phosphate diphosphokinase [Treponema sp.]